MSVSVKVRDVDTSYLGTGGRTLKIKTKHDQSIFTPVSTFSRKEMVAKSELAFSGTFENNIGAIQIDIKGERYKRFLKNNGTVKDVQRTITRYSDVSCCFDNFLVLILLEFNSIYY